MQREKLEKIGKEIVDSAYRVHRELGPGLLESAYETCLMYELASRGFKVVKQVSLPVVYRDKTLDAGYRLDLLIENEIIIELKAVDKLLPVHKAQLISYLKLADKRLGYLINFNVDLIKHGITRLVNNL